MHATSIVASTLALLCTLTVAAEEAPSAVIQIHVALATPHRFFVQGRALATEVTASADKDQGRLGNLVDSVQAFGAVEMTHVAVAVDINGEHYRTQTDSDGLWSIAAVDLVRPLPPGPTPIIVRVGDEAQSMPVIAREVLRVIADEPGVAIISDFDDTLANSGVLNKARLVARTLTRNAAQIAPIPGVSEAFHRAERAGLRGVFYVSGSPLALYPRIAEFLRLQKLPPGPILLKNFGTDAVGEQRAYKTERITFLMDFFPRLRFILVGDAGEQDPEVYRGIADKVPQRVAAIVIRRIAGADNSAARLAGMRFVDDYVGDPNLLAVLAQSQP